MVLAYSLMPVLDVQASRLKTAAPFRMTWLSTPAPPERFDALGRRFLPLGEFDMPTLDFKGKPFVYAHHLSVPFRQLDIDTKKSVPSKGGKPSLDDNLIIHGDNLHALKALLPKYAGKVKCIYIDPPYNTGNEGWCYNDNVNAPLMKEWLKKEGNPVDKEDLERHDKWLCMMWPRLQLLRELLADDGLIFASAPLHFG